MTAAPCAAQAAPDRPPADNISAAPIAPEQLPRAGRPAAGSAASGTQLPLAGADTLGAAPIAPEQLPRAGRPISSSTSPQQPLGNEETDSSSPAAAAGGGPTQRQPSASGTRPPAQPASSSSGPAADPAAAYPTYAAGSYPLFVQEPAYGAYRAAEQQLLRLLQTPDLDQAVQRQPGLTALLDRTVEQALVAAYGGAAADVGSEVREEEEEAAGGAVVLSARGAAHLFLQRLLYRWAAAVPAGDRVGRSRPI
jgi:hypothetical protein